METGYATPPSEDMEYNIGMSTEFDLDATNELLRTMSPKQRVDWAIDTFGSDLYFSTSAGTDSALMIDLMSQVDRPVSAIFINTGFLYEETIEFKDKLVKDYGLQLYEFSAPEDQISAIKKLASEGSKLWDDDPDTYSEITKLEPTSRAIKELGIKALLTGVRRDQTDNRRDSLDFTWIGKDGEVRINPLFDWTSNQVKEYFEKNQLPRHPKYYQGFESVGDIHTTVPGKDRDGRLHNECGFNVIEGVVIPRAS